MMGKVKSEFLCDFHRNDNREEGWTTRAKSGMNRKIMFTHAWFHPAGWGHFFPRAPLKLWSGNPEDQRLGLGTEHLSSDEAGPPNAWGGDVACLHGSKLEPTHPLRSRVWQSTATEFRKEFCATRFHLQQYKLCVYTCDQKHWAVSHKVGRDVFSRPPSICIINFSYDP